MSRIGLGRHGRIDDDAGDPLDGLVNLFDVGMILAVAFLIAGLALTVERAQRQGRAPAGSAAAAAKVRVLPPPGSAPGPRPGASRSAPPTASPTAGS